MLCMVSPGATTCQMEAAAAGRPGRTVAGTTRARRRASSLRTVTDRTKCFVVGKAKREFRYTSTATGAAASLTVTAVPGARDGTSKLATRAMTRVSQTAN